MPRIRNWKDLKLYLAANGATLEHIHELFSGAIDWKLIRRHLPDMLRVALSVSQGRIRSSTILRRLGTQSRKNRLYFAFRELGRVARTVFLLKYLASQELRVTINAATNKSEAWNGFVQWIAFGGQGVINENDRGEQRKIIRYNHLVANLLIFYNVVEMTRVLSELVAEGYQMTRQIVSRLSPYITEHINRFGSYELHFDPLPQPIAVDLSL